MLFNFNGFLGSKKHESNPLETLTVEQFSGGIRVFPFDSNPRTAVLERAGAAVVNSSFKLGTNDPVMLDESESRFMTMFFGSALWSNLGEYADLVDYKQEDRGIVVTFKDPARMNGQVVSGLVDAINRAFEFTKKNCK